MDETAVADQRIGQLLELLECDVADAPLETGRIFANLRDALHESLGACSDTRRELSTLVGELCGRAGLPLDSTAADDPTETLRQVEELKLRMLAVAAAFPGDAGSVLDQFFRRENDTSWTRPSGAVWRHVSGIRSCPILGQTVVVVPMPFSKRHAWEVLNGINELFLSDSSDRPWVLDCSELVYPEALLVASLLGYHKSFRLKNRALRLMWLPDTGIPGAVKDRLVEVFKLRMIGAYFFSTH